MNMLQTPILGGVLSLMSFTRSLCQLSVQRQIVYVECSGEHPKTLALFTVLCDDMCLDI